MSFQYGIEVKNVYTSCAYRESNIAIRENVSQQEGYQSKQHNPFEQLYPSIIETVAFPFPGRARFTGYQVFSSTLLMASAAPFQLPGPSRRIVAGSGPKYILYQREGFWKKLLPQLRFASDMLCNPVDVLDEVDLQTVSRGIHELCFDEGSSFSMKASLSPH